jgi:pimeloyl-ACP methyl ester carboxylesterase
VAVAAPERVRTLVLVSNDLSDGQARIARGFWDPARMLREQPGWWKHMQTVHAHSTPEQLLQQWQALDAARRAWQPEQLARVTMPTLVVAGDRDDVVPLSESIALYRALPHAQLAVLPGIGHGAPTRGAAQFNALVMDVVKG